MAYRPSRYEQVMKASEGLDARARKMLGGMGIYTGEKVFAVLLDDAVALKLSPQDREKALQVEGAKIFRPAPGAPEMSEYVELPTSILDDVELFQYWIRRSAEYARSKSKFNGEPSLK